MGKGLVKTFVAVTAVGAVAAMAVKYIPTLTKLKNFSANVSMKPVFDRVHGFTKTNALRIYLNISLKNFTGFDIELQNVFANIFASKDKGATWYEVADSPSRIDVSIKDGSTVIGKMPLDFTPSAISALNNAQVLYKVVGTFDFKGVQDKIEAPLDLTIARNSIISVVQNLLKSNSSLTKYLKNLFHLKGVENKTTSYASLL